MLEAMCPVVITDLECNRQNRTDLFR